MRPIDARWPFTIVLLLLLAGCGSAPPLNSDRIREQFGSYAVEVLQADGQTRIANLYSGVGDDKICRTLAVVEFVTPMPRGLSSEHAAVTAGGSIGEVFRNAGWSIRKTMIDITETSQSAHGIDITGLMKLDRRAPLATYVYQFDVYRGPEQFRYATITEIYHPDYQTLGELTAAQ